MLWNQRHLPSAINLENLIAFESILDRMSRLAQSGDEMESLPLLHIAQAPLQSVGVASGEESREASVEIREVQIQENELAIISVRKHKIGVGGSKVYYFYGLSNATLDLSVLDTTALSACLIGNGIVTAPNFLYEVNIPRNCHCPIH